MKKYTALFTYNLKRIFNDKANVILAFLMPIGFYALMGAMFQNYGNVGEFMIQAMVPNFLLIIITNALFNIFGLLLVDTISTGNMEKYQLLGIKKISFASILLLATSSLIIMVSAAFIVFVRLYSGVMPKAENLGASIVILALACLSQFSLMFLLTSLFTKTTTYGSFSMIVFMVQMFTGGLTFPVSMFPKALQNILLIVNPMSRISISLQNVWLHHESLTEQSPHIFWIVGLGILCLIISINVQKKTYQNQTVPAL